MSKEVKQLVCKDVKPCPRCGQEHKGLAFRPLQRPFGHANFWAPCPETKEPVMALVTIDLEHAEETFDEKGDG